MFGEREEEGWNIDDTSRRETHPETHHRFWNGQTRKCMGLLLGSKVQKTTGLDAMAAAPG